MSYCWQGEKQDFYLPMINFDTVTNGLYRSGFPLPRNMPFIHKLGIKTIMFAIVCYNNWYRFIEPNQEDKPYVKEMASRCADSDIHFVYQPLDVRLVFLLIWN